MEMAGQKGREEGGKLRDYDGVFCFAPRLTPCANYSKVDTALGRRRSFRVGGSVALLVPTLAPQPALVDRTSSLHSQLRVLCQEHPHPEGRPRVWTGSGPEASGLQLSALLRRWLERQYTRANPLRPRTAHVAPLESVRYGSRSHLCAVGMGSNTLSTTALQETGSETRIAGFIFGDTLREANSCVGGRLLSLKVKPEAGVRVCSPRPDRRLPR